MPVGIRWLQQPRSTGRATRQPLASLHQVAIDLVASALDPPVGVGLHELDGGLASPVLVVESL